MELPNAQVGDRTKNFSTNTSSMKVAQYNADEKACMYFYKRGRFSYTGVMLVGTMQVLAEQSIKT